MFFCYEGCNSRSESPVPAQHSPPRTTRVGMEQRHTCCWVRPARRMDQGAGDVALRRGQDEGWGPDNRAWGAHHPIAHQAPRVREALVFLAAVPEVPEQEENRDEVAAGPAGPRERDL